MEGGFGIVVQNHIIAVKEKIQLQDPSGGYLKHLLDGQEVFKGFRHLQLIYVEMTHMDKVSNPVRIVVVGLRLGHFVLVVGENQIYTPRVDVHILPQNSICHSRTLYVPARSAVSPGGLPERLSRFNCLPKCKIFLISLA